jgi:hypothetical protein
MVTFELKYFSEALEDKYLYEKKGRKFLAFSFILATDADKNIFPELLSHYNEIDIATSNYILVICPYFKLYNHNTDKPLTRDEIFHILETKKFSFPVESWEIGGLEPEEAINLFIREQRKQTYEFAEEHNIKRSSLPCIVFYSTLQNKEKRANERIIWSIKDQDYSSIIVDFRNIVSRLEDKYVVWVTKSTELAQLQLQQETLESTINDSKDKIETLPQEILNEEKRVKERLENRVEKSRLERMKDPIAKRKRIQGDLDGLNSVLEKAYAEKKKAESELPKIVSRIRQLEEEKLKLKSPNVLKEINSLNRKRFVIETFEIAGKFVPSIGLGINIWDKLQKFA